MESFLCKVLRRSWRKYEREIWEGFQEELGKGCAYRVGGERARQAAGAAIEVPVGGTGCTLRTRGTQSGCGVGPRLGGQGGALMGTSSARIE